MNSSDIPLLSKEGWLRDQENIAQPPLNAQTGWLLSSRKFELPNHPGRSHQRLLRGIFWKVASTPPWKGGEYPKNLVALGFSPRSAHHHLFWWEGERDAVKDFKVIRRSFIRSMN